jgi:hypothetical protein
VSCQQLRFGAGFHPHPLDPQPIDPGRNAFQQLPIRLPDKAEHALAIEIQVIDDRPGLVEGAPRSFDTIGEHLLPWSIGSSSQPTGF